MATQKRQSHIDVGTIGSRRCEVALNSILMVLDDAKVTRRVMNRITDLRFCLKELQHVPVQRVRKECMRLYYDKVRNELPTDLPVAVYTHTRCCLAAIYRSELRAAGQ